MLFRYNIVNHKMVSSLVVKGLRNPNLASPEADLDIQVHPNVVALCSSISSVNCWK